MAARARIIVANCVGWPGNHATGPNRSLTTLYGALADRVHFIVIAPNRSRYGRTPIVPSGTVCRDEGVETHYLDPVPASGPRFRQILEREPGALLWLQSFFSRWFSIAPLAAMATGMLKPRPVLISPRGEFSDAALALGSRLKRPYLRLARRAGLLRTAALHATSEAERLDIVGQHLGPRKLFLVPDSAQLAPRPAHWPRPPGAPLRIAFVGRIHPMKGLLVALRALRQVAASVELDIWGPVQDEAYRQACADEIGALPDRIVCAWRGTMDGENVVNQLGGYDLMVLPSESENFGHAIFESLSAATPVLIGDRTPWRGLEQAAAGWDLDLGSPERIAAVIDVVAGMEPAALLRLRDGARAFAEQAHEARNSIERTRIMLAAAAGRDGDGQS